MNTSMPRFVDSGLIDFHGSNLAAILAHTGLRWVAIPGAVKCPYWGHGTRIHFLSLPPKHGCGPSVRTAREFLISR